MQGTVLHLIYIWWKPGKLEKGAPRLPKGAPPIQGPSQTGLPITKLFFPENIPLTETGQARKIGGPRLQKRGPADSMVIANWFAPPPPQLENVFRRHWNCLTILFSLCDIISMTPMQVCLDFRKQNMNNILFSIMLYRPRSFCRRGTWPLACRSGLTPWRLQSADWRDI